METEEDDCFVEALDIIAILQAKARKVLKSGGRRK